jgi:hypothetical protein
VNCFVHERVPAVGVCSLCQKAVCRGCVGGAAPRLVCRSCLAQPALLGAEYRSSAAIGNWPLIHVCSGVDPLTRRPRVARGVVAIGNIAVGGIAVGGLACGLVTIGGASLGLAAALGGAAIGVGVSIGGVAVGSIAMGGAALGFSYALGGLAFAPAAIDGRHCDPAAADFLRAWLSAGLLPPNCR